MNENKRLGDGPLGPIRGDPDEIRETGFDLIVIGGGVYGIMALREASMRGLTAVLFERDDFGGATSWASHRIVHGGLRYLQKLDAPRFTASVRERKWFTETFPDLVEPLPCLMPLYNTGLKRPAVLRAALKLNSAMGSMVGGAAPGIPAGRMLDAERVRAVYPRVRADSLAGGAAWTDARLVSSERAFLCMLRDACGRGALARNRVAVKAVRHDAGRVCGVEIEDQRTGGALRVRGAAVLNCAGPWCADPLLVPDAKDRERLFAPARAFNLVLDVPPPSSHAVAVSAPAPGSPLLFVVPMDGMTAAGTWHEPVEPGETDPHPTAESVDRFLEELRSALPGFTAARENIRCVWSGLLPAARPGEASPSDRPVVIDHGKGGGPERFVSLSGVKLTTARHVVRGALDRLFGRGPGTGQDGPLIDPLGGRPAEIGGWEAENDLSALIGRIRTEEMADRVSDVVLRRTRWYLSEAVGKARPAFAAGMELDPAQTERDLAAVAAIIRRPMDQ